MFKLNVGKDCQVIKFIQLALSGVFFNASYTSCRVRGVCALESSSIVLFLVFHVL